MSDRNLILEPVKPTASRIGSDKVLSWMSSLWLLNAVIGAVIAIREDLPGEFLAGVFTGKDACAEFFRGPGTALSPGLIHIVAQAVCAVLSTRSGRVGEVGAAGLAVVGAGATAGALGETITYRALSPRSFEPGKAAVVSASIFLSSLMTVFGARRLLVLRGQRCETFHKLC